jgi:hypothetical protein
MLLEDSVVGDTVLCPVGFTGVERPDSEEKGLDDDDGEEEPEDDSDEDAVPVTLPEPLVVAETLSVDDMPAFGSD